MNVVYCIKPRRQLTSIGSRAVCKTKIESLFHFRYAHALFALLCVTSHLQHPFFCALHPCASIVYNMRSVASRCCVLQCPYTRIRSFQAYIVVLMKDIHCITTTNNSGNLYRFFGKEQLTTADISSLILRFRFAIASLHVRS